MILAKSDYSCLTHRLLGDFNEIYIAIFKLTLVIDAWGISCEIAFGVMSLELSDKSILVHVMNGLVPSGNKPLHEPLLNKIHDTTWNHWATMG